MLGGGTRGGGGTPICCPNVLSGEVCGGAEIWEGAESILSLVWASDFYSLLLFHVVTNDTVMECIKHDFVVGRVKDIGVQVVFPQSYC